MFKKLILFFVTSLLSSLTLASDLNSPVGKWITISDQTQERTGIVEIVENAGKLDGKIVKIFPGKDRNPKDLCVNCPDDFKNKPVAGLEFLWGFEKQSSGNWANGKLLDPKEGHIYKATLTLIDHGKQLKVRGYWGIFWRTQIWTRDTAT